MHLTARSNAVYGNYNAMEFTREKSTVHYTAVRGSAVPQAQLRKGSWGPTIRWSFQERKVQCIEV